MNSNTTTGNCNHLQQELQVVITCMSKEHRDLLHKILKDWKIYKKKYKRQYGKKPTRYGMIYWLVRYSNLIQPVKGEMH